MRSNWKPLSIALAVSVGAHALWWAVDGFPQVSASVEVAAVADETNDAEEDVEAQEVSYQWAVRFTEAPDTLQPNNPTLLSAEVLVEPEPREWPDLNWELRLSADRQCSPDDEVVWSGGCSQAMLVLPELNISTSSEGAAFWVLSLRRDEEVLAEAVSSVWIDTGGQPHLAAFDLRATPKAQHGGALRASVSTRNIGDASARPVWSDRFYVSADDKFDPRDDRLLTGEIRHVQPLSPNAVIDGSAVRLPLDGVPVGHWYLFAVLDDSQELEQPSFVEGIVCVPFEVLDPQKTLSQETGDLKQTALGDVAVARMEIPQSLLYSRVGTPVQVVLQNDGGGEFPAGNHRLQLSFRVNDQQGWQVIDEQGINEALPAHCSRDVVMMAQLPDDFASHSVELKAEWIPDPEIEGDLAFNNVLTETVMVDTESLPLGREDEKPRVTTAWISCDDFRHLQAIQSRVEQPLIQNRMQPVEGAPLTHLLETPVSTLASEQSSQPESSEIKPELAQQETVEEHQSAASESAKAAIGEQGQLPVVAESVESSQDISPRNPTDASDNKTPSKSQENMPQSPDQVPGDGAKESSAPRGDGVAPPSILSEKDLALQPGGVLVGNGIKVSPVAPRQPESVYRIAGVSRNPRLEIHFNSQGNPIKTHLVRSSGNHGWDAAIIRAAWLWRASGSRVESSGEKGIVLRWTIFLGAPE